MAIVSMLTSMAAWFTPTVLFCVTNFIIATIFIASNNNKHQDHDHDHVHGDSFTRITKVSSFLERARSINLSSYTVAATASATVTTSSNNNVIIAAKSQHQYPSSQPKPVNYSSSSRLAQSIYETQQPPSQPAGAPSLFQRVKSIKFASVYNENVSPTESEQISDSPGQLARAPSFLDRVKSFRISSAFNYEAPSTQPENVGTDPTHNPDHHVIRSKSEKASVKKLSTEMKKSRSEMRIAPDEDDDVYLRRPATARESRNVVDEEVDAKADDFISRFKQQLKLQRLESLVRYNELLNRRN